jgi:hypothetical protein
VCKAAQRIRMYPNYCKGSALANPDRLTTFRLETLWEGICGALESGAQSEDMGKVHGSLARAGKVRFA